MVTYRQFTPTDMEFLVQQDVEMTKELLGRAGTPYTAAFLASITHPEARCWRTLVAEDKGVPVGVLIYKRCINQCFIGEKRGKKRKRGSYLDLFFLAVSREHRRRGIASEMIRQLEVEAMAGGFVQIRLFVVSSNATAMRLYETLGFAKISTAMDYPEIGFQSFRLCKSITL